jgi:hypothetical protein
MRWSPRQLLKVRRLRRLDEVLQFFYAQLNEDPQALANWNAAPSRTRDIYADWMADHWSRKVRFLMALDTLKWVSDNALESHIHGKGSLFLSGGGSIQT